MSLSIGLGLDLSGIAAGSLPSIAFRWRPGDALPAGSTFTRADATTCARQRDANGVFQLAAANVLRDTHYVGAVRTALLETGRTQSALGAASLGDGTYWANLAQFTVTAAPASVLAGATAWRHANLGGAGDRNRFQLVGSWVSAQAELAVAIIQNADAVTSGLALMDASSGGRVADYVFTWATMTGALTGGLSGTNQVGGAIALAADTVLLYVGCTPGAANIGNGLRVRVEPSGASTNTLAAIVHYAGKVTGATFPRSPIVTVASALTQATDALSLAGVAATAPATLYTRWFNITTQVATDAVAAYTSGDAIVPAVDRAYVDIAVLRGSYSAAVARSMLGY